MVTPLIIYNAANDIAIDKDVVSDIASDDISANANEYSFVSLAGGYSADDIANDNNDDKNIDIANSNACSFVKLVGR